MALERIIAKYFFNNCTHKEIQELLLKNYDIQISTKTISRILHSQGLKRRNVIESDTDKIITAIIHEINSDGYNLGYRALHRKLQLIHGLTVKRITVYKLLKVLDSEGLAERFGNRLRRRVYVSKGPNFLWHTDGYDKLKQFGFAIHGCIDGFSRMVLWLEVATTNNDPKVTAYYFMKTVRKLGFVPALLRTDKGSENSLIGILQIAMRTKHVDRLAGEKSFIQGRSVRNQRIESFWGRLRQHSMDFYIQLFKKMQQKNLFNGSKEHVRCLQYCFGPLIKNSLKTTRRLWNTHWIRKQQGCKNLHHGKPITMFHLPEKYGFRNYKKQLEPAAIQRLLDSDFTKKPQLIHPSIIQYVQLLELTESTPMTVEDAMSLYKKLIRSVAEHKQLLNMST